MFRLFRKTHAITVASLLLAASAGGAATSPSLRKSASVPSMNHDSSLVNENDNSRNLQLEWTTGLVAECGKTYATTYARCSSEIDLTNAIDADAVYLDADLHCDTQDAAIKVSQRLQKVSCSCIPKR